LAHGGDLIKRKKLNELRCSWVAGDIDEFSYIRELRSEINSTKKSEGSGFFVSRLDSFIETLDAIEHELPDSKKMRL
jgi:hypothetical protein